MHIYRESFPYPCRSNYDDENSIFYYGNLPFYDREYYYPDSISYVQVRTSALQDNLSYYDKKVISLEEQIESLNKQIKELTEVVNELKGITEE